eukprot:CCRYP_008061-RA/>CCRYP_008061-RA protein AED:0.33 eAED:0.33 QI:0/-1/0/1/-1/1/1/0/159
MTSFYQPDSTADEYERAVAFLQEFHSRRVAALHSASLGVISEEFDDLADDFSLALNVDPSRSMADSCDFIERRMNRTPKIKKTTTSRCLVDLDNASVDDADFSSGRAALSSYRRPSCRSMFTSSNCSRNYELDSDENFVFCLGNSPMSKRQRGRMSSVA